MEIEGFYGLKPTFYDFAWIADNSSDTTVIRAAKNAFLMAKGLDWFLPTDANDIIVGIMVRDFENRKRT